MHGRFEDWKNGWVGIQLGIHPSEIDSLIASLQMIRDDPEQHFHISSDYKAEGGLGDIEVFALPEDWPHNMFAGGRARGPGEEIEV
ncbi:MAG TPA: hypothetical protein VL096_05120 [Pirellulaceae bacterium]|nr:hypothetical protein [Pirellulaceae bacterium]